MGLASATVSLTHGVSADALHGLEQLARIERYEPGAPILIQGDAPTRLVVISHGRVKVWRTSEDGTPITLTLLGPGQLIGSLHAAGDSPHTATVTALTPLELTAWAIADLRRIMDRDAHLAANVLHTVTRYAEQMIQRLDEVSAIPVERRLARTLLRAAGADPDGNTGIDLPLTRQDLADLTSSTLATISRITSRWRAERIIAGHRGHVQLLDLVRLREVADPASG